MPRRNAAANREQAGNERTASERSTTYKIQFDFSEVAKQRLEELVKKTDSKTKAEVVRNALRLYEWLMTEVEPDFIIEVQDPSSGKTIFRFPAKTLQS